MASWLERQKKTALLLKLVFLLASIAGSEATFGQTRTTLSDLDTFIRRYDDLGALLSDSEGLLEYRELLKSYMGYDQSFDPIFAATIEQMRVLHTEIPDFGVRMFRTTARDTIYIEGASSKRSGIERNREGSENALEKARESYRQQAQEFLAIPEGDDRRNALEVRQREILGRLDEIEAPYPEIVLRPSSRADNRRIQRDPALKQQWEKYRAKVEAFKSDPSVQGFFSYFKYQATGAEEWLDIYRRPFAEDSIMALRELARLEGSLDSLVARELALDERVRSIMSDDPFYQKGERDFKSLREAITTIVALGHPREPPELLAEVNEIRQQNPHINAQETIGYLSSEGRDRLQDFRSNRSAVYGQKQSLVRGAQQGNLFYIPVVDNPDELKLEVRKQSSADFFLQPMMVIHSSFGGRKMNECVGGECVESLTPRRWAIAALNGARAYAAEKGGSFDGLVRILPVETESHQYEVIDMMLRSVADTIEIRSKVTNESAKYPLFDAILDQLSLSKDSKGFVAGDGTSISQNTGLAKVYTLSPSVSEARPLVDAVFSPQDAAFEAAVNQHFPDAPFNYNPGGMIYEGMPGDGDNRFVLRSRGQRPKRTKEELEKLLLDALFPISTITKESIELSAVENDIRHSSLLRSLRTHPLLGPPFLELLKAARQNNKIRQIAEVMRANPELAEAFPQVFVNLVLLRPDSVVDQPLRAMYHENRDFVLKALADSNIDPNAASKYGVTLLHLATVSGEEKVVEMLLDRGADPNLEDELRQRPLKWAVAIGRKDIAEMLLDRGATANFVGGETMPLLVAEIQGHKEYVQLHHDEGSFHALRWAIEMNDKMLVEKLLDRGFDPNFHDSDRDHPLITAVASGHREIVALLLDRGANANARDNGSSVLELAIKRGDREMVELLLDRGVSPNVIGKHDTSPLFWAVNNKQKKLVQLLLDRGADPNLRNSNGRILTRFLLRNTDEDIINILEGHLDKKNFSVRKVGNFCKGILKEILTR